MENKVFNMPAISMKYIIRKTGEEVEVIDFDVEERGARSDEDWVTYIDSNGKEHIKEHLNLQLDFKPVVNDTWSKVLDFAKSNKMPTTKNCRIFEMAKEYLLKWNVDTKVAVGIATKLVDEVGIEIE